MVTSRGNSQSPFKPKKKVTPASTPATAMPANFTQRPMSYQTPQLQSNLTPPMTPQVPQISTNQGTQSGYTQTSGQPMQSTQPMQTPMPNPNQPIQTTPQVPNTNPTPVVSTQPTTQPPVTPSPTNAPSVTTPKAGEVQVPITNAEEMIPFMMQNQNFNVGNMDEYKKAQSRINAVNLMGHQEPKTLAKMIESGRFSRADNLITDIAKFNPEFYAQVKQEIKNEKTLGYLATLTDNIMKSQSGTPLKPGQTAYESETIETPAGLDQFNDDTFNKLKERYGENAANYISIAQETMQSPEIQAQAEKVREASIEKAKIKAQIDQIENDVREQLGSEVPESIIGSYIARQTKDLTNRFQAAQDMETAENDMLKSLREDALNTMDLFIKGQQMDFQQQQFAYQQQQDLVQQKQQQFENQLALDKMELEQQKAAPASMIQGATPSGQIVAVNIPTMNEGGITAQIDQIAAAPLQAAFQEMASLGLKPAVNQAEGTYRTTEQQQALYDKLHGKGAKVAKPGMSKHEKGLSVDITNVTPEMAAVMNKHGRFQTAGAGDAGHFDYLGTQQQQAQGDYVLYGLAKKLLEGGSFEPKDLQALGYDPAQFRTLAPQLYIQGKGAELQGYGATIYNKDAFMSAPAKTKETLTNGISTVEDVRQDLSEYRKLVQESGGELTSRTDAGQKMKQKIDSMALTLKEVYNLGVLNGPDYEILLTQIPSAVGVKGFVKAGSILNLIDELDKSLVNKVNNKLKSIGVNYTGSNMQNTQNNNDTDL